MSKIYLERVEGKGIKLENTVGFCFMSEEMADDIFLIPSGWDGSPIVAVIPPTKRHSVEVELPPYATSVLGNISIIVEEREIPYAEDGTFSVFSFPEDGEVNTLFKRVGVPTIRVGVTNNDMIVDPVWVRENLRS